MNSYLLGSYLVNCKCKLPDHRFGVYKVHMYLTNTGFSFEKKLFNLYISHDQITELKIRLSAPILMPNPIYPVKFTTDRFFEIIFIDHAKKIIVPFEMKKSLHPDSNKNPSLDLAARLQSLGLFKFYESPEILLFRNE